MSAAACQPIAAFLNLPDVLNRSTGARVAVASPHAVAIPAMGAYPWKTDSSGAADAFGQTRRQCVSYAAWYLNAHGTPFGFETKGPRGTAQFGDATGWDASARKAGFTVSPSPLVGSIAQWRKGETSRWAQSGGSWTFTAGEYGHVAVVIKIYRDDTVDVAQYNLGESRSFSVSHLRAPRYIYVPLASPKVP